MDASTLVIDILLIIGGIIPLSYFCLIAYSYTHWEVPYTPTDYRAQKVLRGALNIKSSDRVLDLGSGLGEMLVFFSHYPVEVTGVECVKWFCIITRIRLFLHRSKNTIPTVINGNFYSIPYQDYSIIYAFLLPVAIDKMAPELERQMRRDACLISYVFRFPFSREHFDEQVLEVREKICFYLYRKKSYI